MISANIENITQRKLTMHLYNYQIILSIPLIWTNKKTKLVQNLKS